MRRMHDYRGWRFGLTPLEEGGRWAARIEVYDPETSSRAHSPLLLPFATTATGEEQILALAKKHAEDWIDGQEPRAKRTGGA